jgi:hypothetical protein
MKTNSFVDKQKKNAAGVQEAEMTGPDMHTYSHKKGTGGAGGSPVKFVKREGSLESREAMHKCGHLMNNVC